ncbi:MAG: trypsin-like peptidase domain-containing protein [Bacteroidetes bacterium]|nr:trypsin-like peptidase domain-containing protein [Bacteroidota bacterium]
MRKQFTILLILIFFVLPNVVFADDAPIINNVSPNTLDSINDVITIEGENFSDIQDGKRVVCNDDLSSTLPSLEIINWSDSLIKFKFGSEYYISYFGNKNNYKCKLDFYELNYQEGTNNYTSDEFNIFINPNIEQIEYNDNNNRATVGEEVTIKGFLFGDSKGSATINNIPVEIMNWSWGGKEIKIKIPNTESGNLIITTSDGNFSNPLYVNIEQINLCTSIDWSCGSWGACSSNGKKARDCSKISNCEGGTQSPTTSQSCNYTPACSEDTWKCGSWGTCSPQGVQTRSCSRTYDCPSVETAAPATSQYCESIYKPNYQTPSTDSSIVTNQDVIVKSTVKLICPVSRTMAAQGSGTVINSTGLILTNKHVIDGTAGCWVGFIDDYDDEPYFGDRQIADIYKVSSDADVAVLKLRNPSNTTLTSVDISQSNSSSIQLGEILTTYGYPAKFGTKITYTSGDFSGVDGNYLKTTAIIEHGNSGGGAYLKNGAFIGIPTAVVKGSLNSMGYLLSVNKVNSWLNNSIAYNYNNNNNDYSRVSSLLEDMDLSALDSLGLFIVGDEENIKTATESQKVIAEEKNLITKIDNSLSKRISGKILLQVEKNGEGWYVYPDNKKKYYLGRPADAFSIMRNLGLGIKHSELAGYLTAKFPSRLSGKIMLDVEQNGEAYYVNPDDLKGYYLSRPADAFRIMRELGLGITNNDIRKIDVGEVE